MRSIVLVAPLFLVGSVLSETAWGGSPAAEGAASSAPAQRGKYLVTIAHCNDCHTPWTMGARGPEPDLSRLLSGHPETLAMPAAPQVGDGPWAWVGAGTMTAFAGPWGVSFAANLTPDKETGLGSWSEEMFRQSMRTGRHQGAGRPILPPMPYQNVAAMTNEDLGAVFAYLRSIPPIHNRVPQPIEPVAATDPPAHGTR
jgi:hypothetical protein